MSFERRKRLRGECIHGRKKRVISLEQLERRFAMSADTLGIASMLGSAQIQDSAGTCTCSFCMQTMQSGLIQMDPADEFMSGADPAAPADTLTTETPVDIAQTFKLHSNPTAKQRIYLDFNGHTTAATAWNTSSGVSSIVTPAYSLDSDAAFSTAELKNIQWIWERVSEDYIPFDVDVTTEEPPVDKLIKANDSDTEWGIRVVIGGSSSDWLKQNLGGIAFIGSFNWNSDTPAYVFPAQLAGGNEKYVAEAASHEAGHTLGLSHDGRKTPNEEYFLGQGSGETGWASIMGTSYYKNVTQWSKGEYANANNLQDDLAIITTANGFGYRMDDRGSSQIDASLLVYSGNTIKDWGIISTVNDTDVFTFNAGIGSIQINAKPFDRGPNLDIKLELLNSAYQVLATSNPTDLLSASLSWTVTAAAQYYIRISGVGTGDPATTGYSNYASLGQYFLSGSFVAPKGEMLAINAVDSIKKEGNAAGTTPFTYRIERTGDTSLATTVAYTVTGTGTDPANAADFVGGVLPSSTVTFAPGETSKLITINVLGDAGFEKDETFSVNLTTAKANATVQTKSALGTILNDDANARVVVTSPTFLVTSESGGTAKFSVALSMAPQGFVVIPLSSSNILEGKFNKASLIFTAANWNVPQEVIITGVDDIVRDGTVMYKINIGNAVSTDKLFSGLVTTSLTAFNIDNEPLLGAKGQAVFPNAVPQIQSKLTNTQENTQPVTPIANTLQQPTSPAQNAVATAHAAPVAAPVLETKAATTENVEARVKKNFAVIDSYFADLGL